MRLDKLTVKAQEAVLAAQQQAEAIEHAQIEPEHLLDALLSQEEGIVPPILKKLGASPDVLHGELDRHLSGRPKFEAGRLGYRRCSTPSSAGPEGGRPVQG